jgi:cob(I)alamin adenosyltransferase
MVELNRIYTRGGDAGQTSLGDGSRRLKDDLRVEAYGTVDEANAAIGLARLHASAEIDQALARIQNDLFDLGADLCRPGDASDGKLRVIQSQVDRLEAEIDGFNAALEPLKSFVLPGGTPTAASLHLARTITRRAERLVVTLGQEEPINPVALRYLNRLSDLLFVLSRAANRNGMDDVLWLPGANR